MRSVSSALQPGAVSILMMRAPPTVSVPVLSKITVRVRASASSAQPAFHQDSATRRPGDARDIGDRSGEDQRARRRGHEHRKPADRITGEAPGEPGKRQRDRQEQEREAVRVRMVGALAVCAAVAIRTIPA